MRDTALRDALEVLKGKAEKHRMKGENFSADAIDFSVNFIESENKRLKKLREYQRAKRNNRTMQSSGPLQ